MNPETKMVRQRLNVLELAEALGNISEGEQIQRDFYLYR